MNQLIDLAPKYVEKMIDDNIVMIDLRREDEWIRTGTIRNVHKITFFDEYGNYDLEDWMGKFKSLVTSLDQKFVLICAHANRTRTIGDYLVNQGYTNVNHLQGGIALWQQELRETIKHEA